MLAIISVVIVVIVIVLITIFRPKASKEHFAEETTTSSPTVVDELNNLLNTISNSSETEGTYDYIEDITKIPFNKQLLLYASIFSSKTNYDKALNVYVPQMSRWNNFVKPNQEFILNTTNVLPSTIKHPHGLPLKNLQLVGINADTINSIDYKVSSFTVFMVLKIEDFNFDIGEIELFSISLETPNRIRLTIEKDPNDENSLFFYSHVGHFDATAPQRIGFTITKTELTNQDGVAISMVYSKIGSKSIHSIYINNNLGKESEEYEIANDLVLGNSQISINKHRNLDGNLLSFMYYTQALSLNEHVQVYDYYKNQASSVPSIITFVQNVTTEKISAIKSLIEDATTTEANIQEKLNKCLAESASRPPAPPPKFKYNISTGSVRISDADIASCPILKVNRATKSSPEPTPTPTSAPAPTTSTFPFNINIPYLS